MSDSFLDLGSARLAYSLEGGDRGRMLVALHGLTSSRAVEEAGPFRWSALASPDRRLLRYDARAHGRSTGRLEADDYRWDALAQDLFALLDEVAATGPIDALGVSMGVGTLLWAATERPERFRRLVLVIPPTAWATRAAQGAVYEAGARFIEERGLDAFVHGSAALPPLPILEAGGWWPTPPPDVREDLLPTVLRGAARTDFPSEDAVAALPHEVLLLPWPDDPGHPVSTAQRLAELLPHAALEVARTPAALRAWPERIAAFLDV
ncbi:alpha/beta fold hydrolase [Amnibacterium sp. CER49]|uniref:alpha/beta fold hydrolase n=1 Tax=Amnibacterium sp. CER49 TaxID=3039161 RepID=UPI0024481CB6|nr:alpha/beta fold hydrolase [Amnibacterium sp. CER49]MDH2442382.1 alpha/beta fold hydrolase [Amnibacterium sp. CER49]